MSTIPDQARRLSESCGLGLLKPTVPKKQHLRTTHDMSPEDYRAKWNLRPGYVMVPPDYAYADGRPECAKDRVGREAVEGGKGQSARAWARIA